MEIEQILKLIDDSVNSFNESIPAIQRQLFNELVELASKLETKKGRIKSTAANLRLISQIKNKFDRLIIKNKAYNQNVKDFTKAFSEVQKAQEQYFEETHSLKPPAILSAIREQSIEATIDNLKGGGMRSTVIEPIREILKTNITSGAKYSELVEQLKVSLVDTKEYDGTLTRHIKQITMDALNQYARENVRAITRNAGLQWYSYNGAIIDTTREFCKAMHKKKYFHESEIPYLIKGDFKEFKEIDGKLYDKTGLPYGFIPGTNPDNFLVNLAGYNCGHQAIPVDELAVPERIKNALI